MTTPDESDAIERAADRRDNRIGALVAAAGLAVVLIVGGLVLVAAPGQQNGAGLADTSKVAGQLPTYAIPDAPATDAPSVTPTPRPTKTKHLTPRH
jgi:hypothetical protein